MNAQASAASQWYAVSEPGTKGVLGFALCETFKALEESFTDLADGQASAFPFDDGFNIAWNVMHCIENLAWFCVRCQGGPDPLPPDWEWDRYDWKAP